MLGGLIKDSVSETVNKVPLLGDIPILGYLFKSHDQDDPEAEPPDHPDAVHHQGSGDLRRIFDRKLRERREFMERYSAFRDDKDYEAEVDYRRKRGLLEEINQTAHEAEEEAVGMRNAEQMLGRDLSGEVTLDVPAPLPAEDSS